MSVSEINHKTRFFAELDKVKPRIDAVLIMLKAEKVSINWKVFEGVLGYCFDKAELAISGNEEFNALSSEMLYWLKVQVVFEKSVDVFGEQIGQYIKTDRARELMGNLATITVESFVEKAREMIERLKNRKEGNVLEFRRKS